MSLVMVITTTALCVGQWPRRLWRCQLLVLVVTVLLLGSQYHHTEASLHAAGHNPAKTPGHAIGAKGHHNSIEGGGQHHNHHHRANNASSHHSHHSQAIQSPHTLSHYQRAQQLLRSGRCKHIYIDLGSNIGIQIRKLYEPQYYPLASLPRIFNDHYGHIDNTTANAADRELRKSICVFGFEPNPHLTKRLTALEEAYLSEGYNIVMFTETAVGVTAENVSFFLEPTELPENHEWGASMYNWHENMTQVTAGSIILTDFIKNDIMLRKGKSPESHTIMKMDVEGMEFTLLPELLVKEAICELDMIMVEFHEKLGKGIKDLKNFIKDFNFILHQVAGCKGRIATIDDGTYGVGQDPAPLPGRTDAAMRRSLSNVTPFLDEATKAQIWKEYNQLLVKHGLSEKQVRF